MKTETNIQKRGDCLLMPAIVWKGTSVMVEGIKSFTFDFQDGEIVSFSGIKYMPGYELKETSPEPPLFIPEGIAFEEPDEKEENEGDFSENLIEAVEQRIVLYIKENQPCTFRYYTRNIKTDAEELIKESEIIKQFLGTRAKEVIGRALRGLIDKALVVRKRGMRCEPFIYVLPEDRGLLDKATEKQTKKWVKKLHEDNSRLIESTIIEYIKNKGGVSTFKYNCNKDAPDLTKKENQEIRDFFALKKVFKHGFNHDKIRQVLKSLVKEGRLNFQYMLAKGRGGRGSNATVYSIPKPAKKTCPRCNSDMLSKENTKYTADPDFLSGKHFDYYHCHSCGQDYYPQRKEK
ncbi:MAG: hypothetical protein BWY64_03474 [bacterium ADurb.Bin363]|nr:MAG: hypothetical protein BWY64_03474 [bacterium ADurb.Bin363]